MTFHSATASSASGTVERASTRPRIWLVLGLAGWAALLVVLAYVSVGSDAPTVREQRSIVQAAPVVDRTVGELVAAAGPDLLVERSAAKVEEGCRLTPFRDGATLDQAVTFRTTAADAPPLLDRIAQRLPASYRADTSYGKNGTVHRLQADAGEFVLIRGGVTAPGVITLTVTTGCRPT